MLQYGGHAKEGVNQFIIFVVAAKTSPPLLYHLYNRLYDWCRRRHHNYYPVIMVVVVFIIKIVITIVMVVAFVIIIIIIIIVMVLALLGSIV